MQFHEQPHPGPRFRTGLAWGPHRQRVAAVPRIAPTPGLRRLCREKYCHPYCHAIGCLWDFPGCLPIRSRDNKTRRRLLRKTWARPRKFTGPPTTIIGLVSVSVSSADAWDIQPRELRIFPLELANELIAKRHTQLAKPEEMPTTA